MLKKVTRLGLTLVVSALLSSCELLSQIGGKSEPLVAPINLRIVDQTLSWDAATGAEGYEIIVDNQSLTTLSATTYEFIDQISSDQTVTIRSYRTKKEEREYSANSVQVTRYKNTFTTQESLSFDYSNVIPHEITAITHEIPASIRYVLIAGQSGVFYHGVAFNVLNRIHPLSIDVINFNGGPFSNQHALYTTAPIESSWFVIINSKGTANSFIGGANMEFAGDGEDGGSFGAPGKDGKKGGIGYSGLYLPRVVIKGEANISFNGGTGGRGGTGGNGHKNFLGIYENYGGDGGAGGAGGAGGVFTSLVVKLSATSTVSFNGGAGGVGGEPGNSTLLDAPSRGRTGDVGKGYEGAIQIISGIVS